jgi:hypothetical protein
LIFFDRLSAVLVVALALIAVLPARAEQISVTHWGVSYDWAKLIDARFLPSDLQAGS